MNAPAIAATESLAARPGWAKLREAAQELHAAELLTRDPLAVPSTATPHLREFWRAIAAASIAAGIGEVPEDPEDSEGSSEPDPGRWLEGEIAGLDAGARARLRGHWRALADERVPSKRELRDQVEGARSLLARLEPEIGGVPLHRRKRRIAWTCAGLAVLFGPLALYLALHSEVPGTGPWRAAYYADHKLESKPVFAREDSIEHDWGDNAPHEVIPPDKFSIRWDTCLLVEQSGPVVFQVSANDGARLLINGEIQIDAWERDPDTQRRGFGTAQLELAAGVHHLRVEYYDNLGEASLSFSASLDGELPKPLPREQLRYPGDDFNEDEPCAAVR